MTELGKLIRNKRNQLGITQAQLAKETGISQVEIARIENGDRKFPSPKHLRKIALVLNIPIMQLMILSGYVSEKDVESFNPWEKLKSSLLSLGLSPSETEDIMCYVKYRLSLKSNKGEMDNEQDGKSASI